MSNSQGLLISLKPSAKLSWSSHSMAIQVFNHWDAAYDPFTQYAQFLSGISWPIQYLVPSGQYLISAMVCGRRNRRTIDLSALVMIPPAVYSIAIHMCAILQLHRSFQGRSAWSANLTNVCIHLGSLNQCKTVVTFTICLVRHRQMKVW